MMLTRSSSAISLAKFLLRPGFMCVNVLPKNKHRLLHQTQASFQKPTTLLEDHNELVGGEPMPEYRRVEVDEEDVLYNTVNSSREHMFNGLDSSFPCQSADVKSGPEPDYGNIVSGYNLFHCTKPFRLKYRKGVLPELKVAYETWGELNSKRDNVVLVSPGLSASSHLRSHPINPNAGWWEKFVGPGCAIDTNKFYVICANNLGGCYGTTLQDMINAQNLLLDHLGIEKVHATVGASLGGMLSMYSAVLHPERVGRVITISACAKSSPSSIAIRYLQRKAIMLDPNWQLGQYYNSGRYPRMGMKLAREIATLSYRSGPEWEQRFGRIQIKEGEEPTLCPTFMIENYLDYQGESFCMKMDPNTLLYLSKSMDLYDLGENYGSLDAALTRVRCPVMVIGVQTDILFPVRQQRTLAEALQHAGNNEVTYYELTSPYGHDTFLLEINTVGVAIKGFLETNISQRGQVRQKRSHLPVKVN